MIFLIFFAEFLEKPHGNHHIKYIKILEDPILSNVFHGCMMLYAVVCSCIHIFSVGILIISLIPTLSLRELVLQLPRPQRAYGGVDGKMRDGLYNRILYKIL